MRSFPSPGVRVPVGTGGQPGWRGDEREVFFVSGQRMMVASVATERRFAIGKPAVLFERQFASIQGENYDVRPDGQRFSWVFTDPRTPPKEMTIAVNWTQEMKSSVFGR